MTLLLAALQLAIDCPDLAKLRLGHQAIVTKTDPADARCVVKGTIEGNIGFEVNLPSPWNGKLLVVGIGGNAGSITDTSIGWKRNYATATTDTGHQGGADTSWALRNPKAEADFAHRAFHLTAVVAKDLIHRFYGRAPSHSYFTGCSGGGRQGMIAAQRYPADFDGIIAGAPAYNLTGFHLAFIWNGQAMFPNGGDRPVISGEKLKQLEARVLAKCDAIDGLRDGLIDDPRRCQFNPSIDLPACPGAADCFTPDEVAALTKIYGGPRNSRGPLYPGFNPGVESGWNAWLGEGVPGRLRPNLSYSFGEGFLRYWVYDDPNYQLRQFNFERDVAATAKVAKLVNATSTNLTTFQARGGKIIFYHGWADNAFPAAATVDFYEKLDRPQRFARLFLVPGMLHCGGGPGCHQADYLTALEAWVERGDAPAQIIGTGASPVRSRPLCAYPNVARYRGEGNENEATSFQCVAPPN